MVRFESSQIVWRALQLYQDGRDFSDAMLVLTNESCGCDFTMTFDKRAAKMTSAQLLADQ